MQHVHKNSEEQITISFQIVLVLFWFVTNVNCKHDYLWRHRRHLITEAVFIGTIHMCGESVFAIRFPVTRVNNLAIRTIYLQKHVLHLSRLMTKPANWLCSQRRLISLGICPVWSESSLCSQWVAKGPKLSSYGQRRLWSDKAHLMNYTEVSVIKLLGALILLSPESHFRDQGKQCTPRRQRLTRVYTVCFKVGIVCKFMDMSFYLKTNLVRTTVVLHRNKIAPGKCV